MNLAGRIRLLFRGKRFGPQLQVFAKRTPGQTLFLQPTVPSTLRGGVEGVRSCHSMESCCSPALSRLKQGPSTSIIRSKNGPRPILPLASCLLSRTRSDTNVSGPCPVGASLCRLATWNSQHSSKQPGSLQWPAASPTEPTTPNRPRNRASRTASTYRLRSDL
jgi:hypothetical protein